MKKRIFFYFSALIAFASIAFAQSTANQIQIGSISTSSCPGGALSCFTPYSISNPMPVVSN